LEFFEDAGGDLASLRDYRLPALGDGEGQLVSQQAVGNLPEQLLVLDDDVAAPVERPQNLRVALQAQRPEEHGPRELALPVDTDVEVVLVVVLELHPASPVGNDLAQEVALRLLAFEKHAR